MSLVSRLNGVYDRIYALSDRLGTPQHCDFSYKVRATEVWTDVAPRPKITSPPAYKVLAWHQQNVEVTLADRFVVGISRTFFDIEDAAICKIDGKLYSILWIDRDQALTYKLLVRMERAR